MGRSGRAEGVGAVSVWISEVVAGGGVRCEQGVICEEEGVGGEGAREWEWVGVEMSMSMGGFGG